MTRGRPEVMAPVGGAAAALSPAERLRALYELGKPNLSLLVVITGVLGFYLASTVTADVAWSKLVYLVLGIALTSAGACALNMYIERDLDARMNRTRSRPLPSGRVAPEEALAFALLTFGWGFGQLAVFCGPIPAALALGTGLIYAFLYTPLKRKGPLSVWIGAIPGAIPPVMGWATVRGEIGLGGLSLFAILFTWQFPHFLALAHMLRDDYARADLFFLPRDDADGKRAGRQIALGTAALALASLGPFALGFTGWIYAAGALVSGAGFVWVGLEAARGCTKDRARRAFLASISYLPALLALMVLDRVIL